MTGINDIIETLDATSRRVISAMVGYFEERPIPYVRDLARDLDMPVEELRRTLRALLEQRIVSYGPLVDMDDGTPKGSSYFLTDQGVRIREALA